MTITTISKKEIKKYLGNLKDSEIDNKLNMANLGVEKIDDEKIDIEITPNRPDLLSVQGLKRYLGNYFKKSIIEECKAEVPEKDYKVIIDKSVKDVRPYTVCAIVKNLKFDDEKIKEIIDLQEKLHGNYGRNRKKVAIGIYPLEKIKLPIKLLGKKPEEIKFQPLGFPKELNGRQILSQHPTGREYAHLLKDCEIFPVFEDSNNEVLSMPPIINSEKTGKVTKETKEIFIECSGFNQEYLSKTLSIIVYALSSMGGKICLMEIEDKKENKEYISPDLKPEKMEFSKEYINKNLGLELSDKEIENLLARMGIQVYKEKENFFALVPSYRVDVIHEVDLVEEIAIAYGYDNFEPEMPRISTIGEENKIEILKRKIANVLTGLQMLEISTYHLSTKEKQFKKIGVKEFKDRILAVLDSKTENNILRNSLLANSISVLSENTDSSYPQKIFELGKVFYSNEKTETEIGEDENLCISLCHEKANFTEVKQVLDYLSNMINFKYSLKESENPSFIEGRCGEIFVSERSIGFIGEISPIVLKNNKIKMPLASLEISIKEFLA